MKLISFKLAKHLGLKRYFTGKKCKRGHLSERMVSNCNCIACLYERARADYAVNPKRWHSSNPEYFREIKRNSAKRRYAADPEKYREKTKSARDMDPEKARETARKSYRKHYEKNYQAYLANAKNRKARKRGAEGKYSAKDIVKIRLSQANLCAICKVDLDTVKVHVDHIIPLAKGGSNWPSNLQLLCQPCNCRKGAKLAA